MSETSESAPPNPVDPTPRPRLRLKPWQMAAGGALLVVALAYAFGRYQFRSVLEATEDRVEHAKQEVEKTVAELQSSEALVQRLEARRRLHLTLLSMDQRNFGIAQQHLSAAGKLLQQSRPAPQSDLAELTEAVSGDRLLATEDVVEQHRKVLGWIRTLDELVPLAEP